MDKRRTSRIPPAGTEKVRLMVMGVLLVVVVALIVFTRQGGTPADSASPEGSGYQPVEVQENAPPAARVDPARLAEVRDAEPADRVVIEPRPLQHLLEEATAAVPGDFRRMKARRLDDDLYQQILDDPAAFRGQPFVTKGMFAWAAPAQATMDYDGVEGSLPVWRGVFTDELGRQCSFTVLDEPLRLEPGQVVRLDGFFLKRLGVFAPDRPEELVDPTLHFVGKRLVRSYLRMEPVTKISMALMNTVRDYEIPEMTEIPEEPLYHVLSFLQNVDADALARASVDTTSAALRMNPEELRGRGVRLLGTFHEMFVRPLGDSGENPLEISQVYHGILVHGGPSFTYMISLEDKPDWVTSNPPTNVIIEGIFLKRYTYQARNGQPVTCPLIVVKRFLPFRVDSSNVQNVMFYGILGLAGVMVFWFLLSAFRDQHSDQEFRRRYFEQKKRQLKRSLEGDGGEAAAPGPPPEPPA